MASFSSTGWSQHFKLCIPISSTAMESTQVKLPAPYESGLLSVSFDWYFNYRPPTLQSSWSFTWDQDGFTKPETLKMRLRGAVGELLAEQDLLSSATTTESEMSGEGCSLTLYPVEGIVCELQVTLGDERPRGNNSAMVVSAAAQSSARHPNDVKLYFPCSGQSLWSSSALLKSKSPYFKDLLESDFAEGQRATSTSSAREEQSIDTTLDDSDDEDEPTPPPKDDEGPACAAPFHEIVITDASYHTYKAVLVWLATDHIDFAPLTSSFLLGGKSLVGARTARQHQVTSSSKPPLPLPVSPKSVYRLADFLSLPSLAELALSNFKSQLTISTVAYELSSDTVGSYDDLSDVAVGHAVEHWEAVKATPGFEELMRRMRVVDGNEVAPAVVEKLLRKLSGA